MLIKLTKKITKKQKGFSIMELAIYLVIVAFLAIVGTYAFGTMQESARRNKTCDEMDTIVQALLAYQADSINGSLPANLGQLVAGLSAAQTNNGIARASYVTKSTWTTDSATFKDGWNNAFVYNPTARNLTSTNNGGTAIVKQF